METEFKLYQDQYKLTQRQKDSIVPSDFFNFVKNEISGYKIFTKEGERIYNYGAFQYFGCRTWHDVIKCGFTLKSVENIG